MGGKGKKEKKNRRHQKTPRRSSQIEAKKNNLWKRDTLFGELIGGLWARMGKRAGETGDPEKPRRRET